MPEPGTYRRAYLDLHWIGDLFQGLPNRRDLTAEALKQIAADINGRVVELHNLYKSLLQ